MNKLFYYIFAPFRALYKIYFGLVFLITAIIMYPFCAFLVRDEKNVHKVYSLKRIWAGSIAILTGVFITYKGKKNIPNQAAVICANHASYLDILVIYWLFPKTTVFLGKAELQQWPFVRVFFKNMDIPVDRSNSRKAAHSIELTKEAIQKGFNVVIFPEGLIPEVNEPKMARFKNGAFTLALSQHAPVLPITYVTNWKLLKDHTELFGNARPGISKVVIHPIIPTVGLNEKDLVSLKKQTYKVIEEPLKQFY